MKKLFFIILSISFLSADAYDCNKIFEERKNEILSELEKIDEQQQALESLQTATNVMLKEKEVALAKKEAEVDEKTKELNAKLKRIENLVGENKQLLKEINEGKDTKLLQSFAKMGAGKAALIFAEMTTNKACSIMFYLQPKQVGAILEKIPPAKAAKISVMLQKGPPFLDFENNQEIDEAESLKDLDKQF